MPLQVIIIYLHNVEWKNSLSPANRRLLYKLHICSVRICAYVWALRSQRSRELWLCSNPLQNSNISSRLYRKQLLLSSYLFRKTFQIKTWHQARKFWAYFHQLLAYYLSACTYTSIIALFLLDQLVCQLLLKICCLSMHMRGARETIFDLWAPRKGKHTRLAALRVLRAAPGSDFANTAMGYELILANDQLGPIPGRQYKVSGAIEGLVLLLTATNFSCKKMKEFFLLES